MSPPDALRSATVRSTWPRKPLISSSDVPSRASTKTVLLRSTPCRCRGASLSSSPRSSIWSTLRSTGTSTSLKPATSMRAPASIWTLTSDRRACVAVSKNWPSCAVMSTTPPAASTAASCFRCTVRPTSSTVDLSKATSSRLVAADSRSGTTSVTLPSPSTSAPVRVACTVGMPLLVVAVTTLSRASKRIEPLRPTALVALTRPF